jgi:hypothetical protein
MRLSLQNNEEVRTVAADNRALRTRCSKVVRAEPALDLLPRVRYLIDLEEPVAHFTPSAKLLFDIGLHVVPSTEPVSGMVRSVVAINLSDKIIRIHNGMDLGEEWRGEDGVAGTERGDKESAGGPGGGSSSGGAGSGGECDSEPREESSPPTRATDGGAAEKCGRVTGANPPEPARPRWGSGHSHEHRVAV